MPLSTVLGAQSLIKPGVCTTATRPASPYTGQAIYDTTVATTLVWNGSAWVASGGKILQVVSTVKSDTFSSSATSFTDVTGMSVSITPISTTSKVLIVVSTNIGSSGDIAVNARLLRGSTVIYAGDTAGSRPLGFANATHSNVAYISPHNVFYLDSPATTSSTTYKIQLLVNSGTGYINRSGIDRDTSLYDARTASAITALEVSA